MPVVAASGLEGDVVDGDLLRGDRSEIALSDEVFGISGVGLADGENHLALELCFGISLRIGFVCPHLFGLAESSPCFGPTRVEGNVREYLGNLLPRDAVGLGVLQVISQTAVGHAHAHECHHGDKAAVTERELVLPVPHLSKEHVVVELGEFRCEVAQLLAACILLNRFLFHIDN